MGKDFALIDYAILFALVAYLVVSFSRQYFTKTVGELMHRYWKWNRERKWINQNRY